MLGFFGPYEFKGLRLMLQRNTGQKGTVGPVNTPYRRSPIYKLRLRVACRRITSPLGSYAETV
jgi:hypothetical protein